MKLFKVVTCGPKSSEIMSEVTSFYAAEHLNKVIEALKTELADENTDVLVLAEVAPNVTVLNGNN